MIYGFDDRRRPLKTIIDAFEVLARRDVQIGPRFEAPLESLVHPVHAAGAVFGWEIGSRTNSSVGLRAAQIQ